MTASEASQPLITTGCAASPPEELLDDATATATAD